MDGLTNVVLLVLPVPYNKFSLSFYQSVPLSLCLSLCLPVGLSVCLCELISNIKVCAQLRAISSFWMNLPNKRDKKALLTCIVNRGWSDSRLPWLDIVILCMDGVGLK